MSEMVETYECNETAAEPIEATEEAVQIMESLGLSGQQELLKKDEHAIVRRSPYREMTADEIFVYGVLCPVRSPLATYKSSPIPLRVLQVAAHAHATGLFRELMVWDRGSAAEKDPVLVGMKPHPQNPDYSWRDVPFILARWGDELEAFATLLKRAVAVKRESLIEQVNAIASRLAGEEGRLRGIDAASLITAGPNAKIELVTF